ncbi:MAG TPA: hypothetical protein PKG48_12890 [Bacteroidales bacterium]|nr:hypothetical protein [Bacteroidales bacterium]
MKASRLIILLLLLCPAIVAWAQIPIRHYTAATDTFYWKRYAHIPAPPRFNLNRVVVKPKSEKVNAFLASNPEILPGILSDSLTDSLTGPAGKPDLSRLKGYLYPVEINGDSLTDMIYSGPAGTSPGLVRIWINLGGAYELAFEDYQYVSEFTREGGRLKSLVTGDVGGESGYLYFTREYRVENEGREVRFIRGKQVVRYRYTEDPPLRKFTPAPFQAAADTLVVRASAMVRNEPFDPKLETFGNIIARYREQVRGTLLAWKQEKNGRPWYFVEINPSVRPSASILYGTEKIPAFLRGWVPGESIRLEKK